MQKTAAKTEYTPTQREAFRQGLQILEQARTLAHMIGQQAPEWGFLATKWLNEAQLIQQSFEFFLSEKADASRWRFAAEINHPQFLLNEMNAHLKMYHIQFDEVIA